MYMEFGSSPAYKKPLQQILVECELGAIVGECAKAFDEHSPNPFLVEMNFSDPSF